MAGWDVWAKIWMVEAGKLAGSLSGIETLRWAFSS